MAADHAKYRLALNLWAMPVLVLLAVAYFSVSQAYPYYFLWDMDLVVGLDCLLIGGGLLPDHIHHTGFGMYMLLSWLQQAAHAWGLVSVLDLGQMAQALNPLACLAELIDFLRRFSPLVCLSLVLLLWASLRVMFRPGLVLGLLALGVLGLEQSQIYQAALARTELYSLLFWAGSVLLLVLAGRAADKTRPAWLALAGLLMGLTLLTKVQSAFYLAAAPLFFLLAGLLQNGGWHKLLPAPSRRAAWLALALAWFNLALFSLLLWRALPIPIPEGMGAFMFRFEVGLTKRALLVLALLAGLAIYQLIGLLINKTDSPYYGAASLLSWLLLGFMAAFGLHFLVLSDPGQAWRWLLLDFKMTFLREGFQLALLKYRMDLFAYCWLTISVHLAALGLLAWAASRRFNRALNSILVLALLLSALALAGVLFSDRFILRDLIWVETMLNFLSLAYLLTLARFMGHRRAWRLTAGALAGVLLVGGLVGSLSMPARIDANVNKYGWSPQRYFHGVFGANHRLFDELMRSRYGGQNLPASWAFKELGAQAYRHAEIRGITGFVFRNLPLNLTRVGAVLPGQPVWTSLPQARIKRAPQEMSRALLLDPLGLTPGDYGFLNQELIWEHSEYLDKTAPAPSRPALAILPRGDLRVYLFVEPGRLPSLRRALGPGGAKQRPLIQISDGEKTLDFVGLELTRYTVLPLRRLGPKYFFVIQPRYPI